MRYREIVESYYEGQKQRLLQQITPPDDGTRYTYNDPGRPRLTLRMLQKLRYKKDKLERERQEHLEFLPTMYFDPCDDCEKKRESKKSKDKIETHAMKLAAQAIKDKHRQEEDAAKTAMDSIKRKSNR